MGRKESGMSTKLIFEISMNKLENFTNSKVLCVRVQFANTFKFKLKGHSDFEKIKTKQKSSKLRRVHEPVTSAANVVTRTVFFSGRIDLLISDMVKHPIEISLVSKHKHNYKLGANHIPWNHKYIEYLNCLMMHKETTPLSIHGVYNIYNEYSLKQVATINMCVKLGQQKNSDSLNAGLPPQLEDISKNNTVEDVIITNNLIVETTEVEKFKHDVATDPGIKKSDELSKNVTNNVLQSDQQEIYSEISSFIQSDISLHKTSQMSLKKSTSYSSIIRKQHLNILDYIFADQSRFGNKTYCVGYCTVHNDSDMPSSKSSDKKRSCKQSGDENYDSGECSINDLFNVTTCSNDECAAKQNRPEPPPPRAVVDVNSIKFKCCEITEEVEGEVKTKFQVDPELCMCSCECKFGFTKTTYCNICGGYESLGKDESGKVSFPCPMYHKLMDRSKLKTLSGSGSDYKNKSDVLSKKSTTKIVSADKKTEDSIKAQKTQDDKSQRKSTKGAQISHKGKVVSVIDPKNGKKRNRLQCYYAYKAPHIGHNQCAVPCTGTLDAVPKSMGWLWNAEDTPGMKFRPKWLPGAINKHVVRLLKIAKDPRKAFHTKKRKRTAANKRVVKRPLLVVQKKHGEFTITMETMKIYNKPRTINQNPYEDKPVLTYTVGRTDEENRDRLRRKKRHLRKLEKEKAQYIQSTFKDMCEDICLKTYQQALGTLPNAENPPCTCLPANPETYKEFQEPCLCSSDESSNPSDTDSDEWIFEFTPPTARYEPSFKPKKTFTADNSSQYTYLDYKVKLIDRYGNPVPRFFIDPDGKHQCSDLGGFWGPNGQWLYINIDGYVALDNRWAPNNFIGPNGAEINCEEGKFPYGNKWLIVGIDGYIDHTGRWKFYPRPRRLPEGHKLNFEIKKEAGDKHEAKVAFKPVSDSTWSCFGDASPKELSKMGIRGHGHDKKLLLATLKELLALGEDVNIPQPSTIPKLTTAKGSNKKRVELSSDTYDWRSYISERTKCKHAPPSSKGVIATDEDGNKTYFKLSTRNNNRPKDRLVRLKRQGISLSSFHIPCLRSFINCEEMKKQLKERLLARARQATDSKDVGTQAR